MIEQYDVLVESSGDFAGWIYLGKCSFGEIERIASQSVKGCKIYHAAVTGSLSKEEKREIASRHGI